ncbi:MAG: hypothetical protein KDA96_24580, partial [Planctomycetaceae bacterium]|nr:hypothetical protein [Planctomycetaceae bacterium]
AMGRLERVLLLREEGAERYPQRPEIHRAIDLIHSDLSGELEQRLYRLAEWEPLNPSVQAALIRHQLAVDPSFAVLDSLQQLTADSQPGSVDWLHRMRTACDAAALAADLEARSGRIQTADQLHAAGQSLAGELVAVDPLQFPRLVQQLVRGGRLSEAVSRIRNAAEFPPELRCVAWIELVRFADQRREAAAIVAPEMVQLIRTQPDSPVLRVAYAEMLLSAGLEDVAEETLRQLLTFAPDDATAMSRLAWILAVHRLKWVDEKATGEKAADEKAFSANDAELRMRAGDQNGDIAEILQLAHLAIDADPGNVLIRVNHARVMLALGQYSDSLDILVMPERIDSTAALMEEAAARLQLGQVEQALELAREADVRRRYDPLVPADEILLRQVIAQAVEQSSSGPSDQRGPVQNDLTDAGRRTTALIRGTGTGVERGL